MLKLLSNVSLHQTTAAANQKSSSNWGSTFSTCSTSTTPAFSLWACTAALVAASRTNTVISSANTLGTFPDLDGSALLSCMSMEARSSLICGLEDICDWLKFKCCFLLREKFWNSDKFRVISFDFDRNCVCELSYFLLSWYKMS